MHPIPPALPAASSRTPRPRARTPRLLARAVGVLCAFVAAWPCIAAAGPGATAWAATGPGAAEPAVDLPPPMAMVSACESPAATADACDGASLAAIDAARAGEGLGPLTLPPAFASLPTDVQLVVVTNAERRSRGLPPFDGPARSLQALALAGARRMQDPTGPTDTDWASNLAVEMLTALQVDYEWMYDDGVGGSNAACRGADTVDCWRHRDTLLAPWGGSVGVAAIRLAGVGGQVFTELVAAGRPAGHRRRSGRPTRAPNAAIPATAQVT
jgi:hypothetical protein